ncbi:MAG: exonuclease subunit SbcD [Verrucomicrobiota bacterium]
MHSADWHLGKPLGDLSRAEEHEKFLAFLLASIKNYEVDVLLVAGDVFDSAHPPQSAVAQYFDFISKLHAETNCVMVVTSGNHDSPAHLDAPKEVLAALRVHVVGCLPNKVEDTLVVLPSEDDPQLAIAAMPFLRDRDLRTGGAGLSADAIQKLLRKGIQKRYAQAAKAGAKWKSKGTGLLAMGHLTVKGGETSDSERDIHVGGLGTVGAEIFPSAFDYVALGHLHRPQAVGNRTEIRYSGSPLPLSFSEAGDEKEVRILDFADGKLAGDYRLQLPLARRLIQWRLQREELPFYLTEKKPPKSELTPWVEVIVEDPLPGENLYEVVRELAHGRPYEVVRVVGKRPEAGIAPALIGEFTTETDADELLRDPKRIFEFKLDDEESLTETEKNELRTAFDELLEIHEERQREDLNAA